MDDTRVILSVSELNQSARSLLEESFHQVWIEGEISNLSQPSSGHCYFTLRDANAQIRCAFFRLQHQRLKFKLENGLQILVRAQVSLYEARGDYQLIVAYAEPAGDGLLQRAYEQLKQKLEAEGLFAEIHKKSLPMFPKQIGVITSATGAAIRDILKVLHRRCINIPVVIYPSQVQGERAAAQLIEAIQIANQRRECEVLILTRGGGSLEDLWPFNDEKLAYAIFNSEIPIISGVGHEVDFTIADFVADRRAPTPSAAAELASPNQTELIGILQQFSQRLLHLIKMRLQQANTQLLHLSRLLKSPAQRLQDQAQHLDLLEKRLQLQMRHSLDKFKQQLHFLSNKLNAISPLRTLERGYAILTKASDKSLVRDSAQLQKGDVIEAKLAKGHIKAAIL